jgi:nucleotide-binding universal stress UspA family protein
MDIRTIFVPIRGDGKGEHVLNHALALARRSNAHLEVTHCRPGAGDLLPLGSYLSDAMRKTITQSASAMADEEENRLREVFDSYCAANELVEADTPPWPADRPSARWREEIGKQADIIAVHGRMADVVAVARPDKGGALGHNSLESAIFSSGRLTLVCPPSSVEDVGHHVAMAWNGSTEAARALYMALPVLTTADKVTLLFAATGDAPDLGAADAGAYLATHGISAEVRELKASRTGVGQEILATASQIGADVLLMGAYGQSRQRELIMGGVTRHIIDHAGMPVLLAH